MSVIASLLPTGTVSGAPKLRAIQRIYEVMPHKRGVYSNLGAPDTVPVGNRLAITDIGEIFSLISPVTSLTMCITHIREAFIAVVLVILTVIIT
jgi:hypothetical protein